ncbi:ribonuclease Z [Flavobacterium sp. MAH-1]|uniref:Ribonuclease Z n=1 Tax=Flavobacterium agri TaxID=2743471 RepID=A0A7Y8Y1Z2_9FLAO|nr:ribonuclease Z [Flavobacterium agri]NUY79700.1 ribonuclease Z [Flavobacterium agri]NYA69725.1 ribonuclease Z [Flavobacterium agri]
MKCENKGNICIIKDNQDDITAFLMKLTHEHKTFEKQNLIVDISKHSDISVKQINAFLPLSKAHKKGKKSFVIIADVDFNSVSDKLVIVPTLQEAHDMIEMDEIERDLGF